MKLNLQRPIVFFDLETTGLNVGKDKIIEISLLKVMPDGTETIKTELINPGKDAFGNPILIPEVTIAVHQITNEMVKNKPTFDQIADDILDFIGDADLAGFNSNKFDLPLLVEEFLRIGRDFDLRNRRSIDVQNIYHKMEPRNLAAAYKFYCHAEIQNAHQAEVDTKATYEVFKGQIEKYEGQEYTDRKTGSTITLRNDMKLLSDFTKDNRNVDLVGHIILNEKDEPIFNFGKHRGQTVREVFMKEPPFYDWMMRADFPLYTKKQITIIYNEVQFEKKQNKIK